MNPEDLLTRTLSEVAEQTEHPATSMAAVARRAHGLRSRRRRTALLGAAAAVALVVTPAAVWLRGDHTSSPEPTRKPSPSVATSADSVRALRALPPGPEPTVAYRAGDTYVDVGGSRLHVARTAFSAVPAQGGGLLVSTLMQARRSPIFAHGTVGRIAVTDQSGGPAHDLGCGSLRFAISADRTQTAYWLMNGCRLSRGGTLYAGPLSTMGQSGQPGIPTPKGLVESPVGFVGAGVVTNASRPVGGTARTTDSVWVLGAGAPQRITTLRDAASVTEGGPSGDLVAGSLSGGGSGVVDLATGKVLWTAPRGWFLGAFSLDGTHVLARSIASTGNTMEILDAADGHLVAKVPPVKGTITYGQAWGEDGSLEIVLGSGSVATGPTRGAVSAIVRVTPTGHLTRVTPVVRNRPNPAPDYRLGTNP